MELETGDARVKFVTDRFRVFEEKLNSLDIWLTRLGRRKV